MMQPRPGRTSSKSTGAALAIWTCVIVRLLDAASDAYVAYLFHKQGQKTRFWSTVACLGGSALVAGLISFARQWGTERRHNPILSFILGCGHVQIVVEAYDSVRLGTKTGALKLLMSAATITNSIPNCLFQTYIGFVNGFFWEMAVSIGLAILSMSLTLISVEKEMYKSRGLGKLPIFSSYSVVLFFYRIIEVPSRILQLMLFAAAFRHLTWFLLGGDLIMLILIRSSTVRRQNLKLRRTRLALTEAMGDSGQSAEDLKAMGLLDEEDYQVQWSIPEYILRYLTWMLVYLDGLDPIPFLMLRLLEQAVMVALFLLFAKLGSYEMVPLIITACVAGIYFFISPLWQFWRSQASFLHPQIPMETLETGQGQSSGEVTGVELVPPVNRSRSRSHTDTEGDSEEEDKKEANDAPVVQSVEQQPMREVVEQSSSAAQKPAEARTEVVQVVAAPPVAMSTIGVQYDWEARFRDQAAAAALAQSRANQNDRGACSIDTDTGCVVM